jgi:hypothetical protein
MKTVAVDFDGVIHTYERGWADGSIYGEPLPGAIEGVRTLQKTHAVFVFTSRDPLTVCRWLEERGIPSMADLPPDNVPTFWNSQTVVLVTNRKLPAVAYLDDRAVRFVDWDQAMADLRESL